MVSVTPRSVTPNRDEIGEASDLPASGEEAQAAPIARLSVTHRSVTPNRDEPREDRDFPASGEGAQAAPIARVSVTLPLLPQVSQARCTCAKHMTLVVADMSKKATEATILGKEYEIYSFSEFAKITPIYWFGVHPMKKMMLDSKVGKNSLRTRTPSRVFLDFKIIARLYENFVQTVTSTRNHAI